LEAAATALLRVRGVTSSVTTWGATLRRTTVLLLLLLAAVTLRLLAILGLLSVLRLLLTILRLLLPILTGRRLAVLALWRLAVLTGRRLTLTLATWTVGTSLVLGVIGWVNGSQQELDHPQVGGKFNGWALLQHLCLFLLVVYVKVNLKVR